mmetsp:Transcript_6881/g.15208  ORF Transcript_6881/g.15208 Transcript_6881/m.15208 type:complete len:1147 (+) Transcript_6881:201-3641(+)
MMHINHLLLMCCSACAILVLGDNDGSQMQIIMTGEYSIFDDGAASSVQEEEHAATSKLLAARALDASDGNSEPSEQALTLHATAYRIDEDPWEFGGVIYDSVRQEWRGVNESSIMSTFRTHWDVTTDWTINEEVNVGGIPVGKIDVFEAYTMKLSTYKETGEELKSEGIEMVPMCKSRSSAAINNSTSNSTSNSNGNSYQPEFWVCSESNSKTKKTSTYFTKRFGQPDINTYVADSLRPSRLVRVSSTGEVLEEIPLPEFMLWDGVFHWDPMQCYGTRVYQGLHDLSVVAVPAATGAASTASSNEADHEDIEHYLVGMNQIALYQDGGLPTVFEGSHVRLLFWKVHSVDDPNNPNGCHQSITYSHAYRYQTSRLIIDPYQKGGRHVRAAFGFLALSPTEFLVAETEFMEAVGTEEYISDVFYIQVDPGDTVDHCESLVDCNDVAIPVKRHLVRRRHIMELSSIAWGPDIQGTDGQLERTVVLNFENDYLEHTGILMELYTLDMSKIALEPVWENNKDSTAFVQQRTSVLITACVVFAVGIVLQHWFLRRQMVKKAEADAAKRREEEAAKANEEVSTELDSCAPPVDVDVGIAIDKPSPVSSSDGASPEAALDNVCQSMQHTEEQPERHSATRHLERIEKKFGYKEYVLASAVTNSCLLGGIVFGFPGLVLILRREGVFSEVCSCGVYCSGQQEQMAILSTIGFAAAIGSRLFAGIFLDKFGPKLTAVLSGLVSFAGLLLLATAKDVTALDERITPAWIILAVGGSSMHLTSFHVTNLQKDAAEKRKASLAVSAGFGAGSLLLPVLQVINQYGGVSLQTICAVYSSVAILLTINSFFVQPWRAWNALGSHAELDVNLLRASWWPSSINMLTAIKRKNSAKFPPLNEVLKSFVFWGECFWFSSQLFLLTYYLSTINQILFALGDARVNADVDSFANNMFTRAGVFFNGLGFLWSPIVGYSMKTRSIYFRIYVEIIMALVMAIMLTIPIIEVQVVVFLLQALVRLQVFSNHFSYIGERFGFRHFGLLNGLSSLVAGSFGLLGYLLQIYSLFVAKGAYSMSYFMVAGLVVSSSIFPFILKKKDQAAMEKEKRREGRESIKVNGGELGKQFKQSDGEETNPISDSFDEFLCYLSRVRDNSYESFLDFLYRE